MSSSEKVSEKPRENDKPPAYPVTRRRVTHFFFPSLFFPLPLFILHFLPPSTVCPSSSSGLTLIAVCESPSFPPFSTLRHFYTFIRRCERLETIEPIIITIERSISRKFFVSVHAWKEKSYDLSPVTKLYHRTPPDQTKSPRPIFLESNLLRGSSLSSPSSPIEQREESSIRSSSSRFSRTRGPDRGSQLEEVDAKKEEGTG